MNDSPEDLRDLFDTMTDGYSPLLDLDRITQSNGNGRRYAVTGISGAAAVAVIASTALAVHAQSDPHRSASVVEGARTHPAHSSAASDPTGGIAARSASLPLYSYELRYPKDAVVQRAEDKVADTCMRTEGFTPRMNLPTEPYDPGDFTPNATTGYNDAPPDAALSKWQSVDAAYQALPPASEAYTAAYYGTRNANGGRDGGCLDQGERAVLPSGATLAGVDPLVKTIDLQTWNQADHDPRVVAVAAAWSRCMARSGYHYSTPAAELNNLPYNEDGTPSSAEVAQAHADIACQTVDRYWPIQHDVVAGYERTAIAHHVAQLTIIRHTLDTEYNNAVAILRRLIAATIGSVRIGKPVRKTRRSVII